MNRYEPLSPAALAHRLTELLAAVDDLGHPLRVAVDGPEFVDRADLIDDVRTELRAAGRPVALIEAADFHRDAALRFEYGRTDVESFYSGWLDVAALNREVLLPLAGEHPRFLPSLRDRVSNRATRARPQDLDPGGVAFVDGQLLLGVGLAFDLHIHLSVNRQARRRLAAEDVAWQLPAFDRYDVEVDPVATAELVIRYDDPRHPALLSR